MKMKRVVALLLVGILLCLSSCGKNSQEEKAHIMKDGEKESEITAVELTKEMKLGWNLGNTLDATDGSGLSSETSWSQPKTTKKLISYVKEAGFTTIRIPVSWGNHMTDGKIDEKWMNRVQEIVDWALEEDLYVIINSHHDNPYYYPSDENLENAKKYLTDVWTQVSSRFKDYDDHLIFEAMNEPRFANTEIEWWFSDTDSKGINCIENINVLNQVFVDTVRSSGGQNKYRFLMVPSAIAAPQNATNAHFVMPTDTVSNKLILSVHAYTPYDFTMNDFGYDVWSLGSKSYEFNFMRDLKREFIDQGYGVVIGEFGATNKDNLESRVLWAKEYVGTASSLGIPCVLWDNGGTDVGNENFGMIDRKNLKIYYPELLDEMLNAYK